MEPRLGEKGELTPRSFVGISLGEGDDVQVVEEPGSKWGRKGEICPQARPIKTRDVSISNQQQNQNKTSQQFRVFRQLLSQQTQLLLDQNKMGKLIYNDSNINSKSLRLPFKPEDNSEDDDGNSADESIQWSCSLCRSGVMTSLAEIVSHCKSPTHRYNHQTLEQRAFRKPQKHQPSSNRRNNTAERQIKLQDRLDECRATQDRWAQQQQLRDRLDDCGAIQQRVIGLEQQQQQWHVNHTLMLSLLGSPSVNGDHLYERAVRLLETYETSQEERMAHETGRRTHAKSDQRDSLPEHNTSLEKSHSAATDSLSGLECIRLLAFS